ncbi:unnamed protein product [Allacma fusca]|uniref:Protein HGH1 homolog n=1 Tax=Allacma fusca TaxID=39272 RepID=A0A8J2KZN0_9HEXA|nr:unnamed protein product [Allacma fusca]
MQDERKGRTSNEGNTVAQPASKELPTSTDVRMKNSSNKTSSSTVGIDASIATENAVALSDKLKALAGYLDLTSENENFEDAVLDGLIIYISNIMTQRIEKFAGKVIGKKNWDEVDITGDVGTDVDVELLHSFFAVVTNFCSHNRSAILLMKSKELFQSLSQFWFDLKNKALFPFSLPSLQNLSTEVEKRDVLLQEHPSVLIDVIQIVKDSTEIDTFLVPLTTFLANMTTTREVRRLLLKAGENGVFEDICKCLDPMYPKDVRLMVSRFVKHMTADEVSHWYLLQESVNILPIILLPLAGGETFADDEYSTMPVELQYLEPTKTREEDSEVRENLLFALLQLCRLKRCREKVRDSNSYYILRELHKFETQESMIDLVERIVDLLIRTEEEIGEKGDFVDFQVPEIEQWLNGDFVYPEEPSNMK